jgi:nitrate reductase assembly molybdenum cofactor insertion protein NarJ
MKKTSFEGQVRELVAQAAAWRLASLLLERPRPEWKDEIGAVRSEVADEELSSCVEKAEEGTEEDYHRLFGPGGDVSPREVSYCGFEDPGRLMAELQSYYQAFSYLPRREESIDHVSVEAGFVGYLFLKEAYARTQENTEAARITKSARSRFMKAHVSRCAAGIFDRLNDSTSYLQRVFLWLVEKERNDQ